MWRDSISRLFADAIFQPPATATATQQLEDGLQLRLPRDLRSLLLESNGVAAHCSTPLVWSAEEMLEQNRSLRQNSEFVELYMPFNSLLFFGADGGGDQFAYRILGGRIRDTSGIYRWDHESDNRIWFAQDLEDYFQRAVME